MNNKRKTEKPRLRLTLNCILGYLIIFFGITIIRDIVAPKKKLKSNR